MTMAAKKPTVAQAFKAAKSSKTKPPTPNRGSADAAERDKTNKYKSALKDSKGNRTQYDYQGEDSEGGVYEKASETGFGKTKSYYRNTREVMPKQPLRYDFPITYEAVKSKQAKASAKTTTKKKGK
jgi:O6-methylguanine-DNA--protein-cysteine methyltransferase